MRAGEIYENPVTGERVIVLEGSDDTGGDYAVADLYVAPGGAVAQAHVHETIEERFEVLEGEVAFLVGDRTVTLGPGETASVPEGTVHDWWNAGEETARVEVRVSRGPSGDAGSVAGFENMISTMFGLARAGETNRKGMPSLLRIAVIARENEGIIRFTKPPRVVQRVLFGALAPIARARGYGGTFPYGEPEMVGGRARETVAS